LATVVYEIRDTISVAKWVYIGVAAFIRCVLRYLMKSSFATSGPENALQIVSLPFKYAMQTFYDFS